MNTNFPNFLNPGYLNGWGNTTSSEDSNTNLFSNNQLIKNIYNNNYSSESNEGDFYIKVEKKINLNEDSGSSLTESDSSNDINDINKKITKIAVDDSFNKGVELSNKKEKDKSHDPLEKEKDKKYTHPKEKTKTNEKKSSKGKNKKFYFF